MPAASGLHLVRQTRRRNQPVPQSGIRHPPPAAATSARLPVADAQAQGRCAHHRGRGRPVVRDDGAHHGFRAVDLGRGQPRGRRRSDGTGSRGILTGALLCPVFLPLGAAGAARGLERREFTACRPQLVGGLASCSLGIIVAGYASKFSGAGAIYAFVSRAASPSLGFFCGWLYFAAVFLIACGGTAFLAVLTQQFCDMAFGASPPFLLVLVLENAALAACTVLDVRQSTRTQLVVTTVSALLVLGCCAYAAVIVRGAGARPAAFPRPPRPLPRRTRCGPHHSRCSPHCASWTGPASAPGWPTR